MSKAINVLNFSALISRISSYTAVVLSAEFIGTIHDDVLKSVNCAVSQIISEVTSTTHVDLGPLFDAIKSTQKIEAIKQYRLLTGFGLKESKDAVESIWPK